MILPVPSQTARDVSRKTPVVPSFRRRVSSRLRSLPRSSALLPKTGTLARLQVERARIERQKLIPAGAAEHLDQRRVGVEQLALGSAEVHAFLQGLEEFGEAAFFLAFFGDVAGEGADAHHFVALDDGIQHAVEIQRARAALDLDADQSRPAPLLQKAGKTAFDIAPQRLGQKLIHLVAYDVGIVESQQLGDAAIYRPQRTVERAGKRHVVKRVDEFLEAALRALNDLAQLIELLVGRSHAGAVAQVAQQVLQFRNFAAPSVHVGGKQDRQHQESDGKRSQVIRKVLQPLPGKRGQAGRQQDHEGERQPPQPGFFLFQISWSAARSVGSDLLCP